MQTSHDGTHDGTKIVPDSPPPVKGHILPLAVDGEVIIKSWLL